MTKYILIILLFIFKYAQSESYVKAGDSLIWDSEKQSYTANGDVEFQNDKFIAFADEMIAQYIEQKDKEVFTIVELFNDCLLYTSPSPRDATLSRMPSSA